MNSLITWNPTQIELIVSITYAIAFISLLGYQFTLVMLVLSRKKQETNYMPSVSLIVVSRNYLESLETSLPLMLQQNYPDFEVVVVDDCSKDGTEQYLQIMQQKYPKLKTTFVKQETDFSNALSLTVGIRAASKDWLIFLHPQCEITSSLWLESYSAHLAPDRDVVFGYTNVGWKGGFGRRLMRYENIHNFLFNSSARIVGLPMPTSDINLAYRRKFFLEKRGFAAQLDAPFCENELFANKVANRKNSVVAFTPGAVVSMTGKIYRQDWLNLKQKQLLIRKKFSVAQRIYLKMEAVSRVSSDVTMTVLLFISPLRWWFLGSWIFRNVLEILWLKLAIKRLGEKKLLPWNFLYSSMLPLIDGIITWNQIIAAQRNKWK